MSGAVFDSMKRYVGFDVEDARRLAALAPVVEGGLSRVVDDFYAALTAQPEAMAVITGGRPQLDRLRRTLREWMRTLFCGEYDEAYMAARSAIGRAHVRVGLPQRFMVTAMEVVRRDLEALITGSASADASASVASLHKLLALDLGVMLEAYKDSYSRRVRAREREAMEAKLTRAEHLAEIGQLAASLAHEIKNPLAGISGAIQIIREDLGREHPHSGILGEVMGQIQRLDAVVKDLLVYARPTDPRFETCDIDATVRRVLTVLRGEPAMQGVPIRYTQNGSMPEIEADEGKIEQLVLNLLLNGGHACREGGDVEVTTHCTPDTVTLIVSDTGHGMDEKTLARATEPFFTSKAKGTGLGLSICKSIADAHNGTFSLESKPGAGTRAEIVLPRRQNHVV